MNKNFTQEQWFHEKLSETATPSWGEGWESMSHLLDETYDTIPAAPFFGRKQWFATAAAIALLAGFSLFWLWRQPVQTVDALSKITTPFPTKIKSTLLHPPTPVVSHTYKTTAHSRTIPSSKEPTALPFLHKSDQNIVSIPVEKITPILLTPNKNDEIISLQSVTQPQPPLQSRTENIFTPTDNVAAQEKSVRQWHIALKLNANNGTFAGKPSNNFNPLLKGASVEVYPSVYISREISRQFSVQTGIAFVSPVDIRHQQLNRTVSDPSRALAANVSASEDNLQLSRLYYMDIPLTMQYHLNKNISINSGLQVSVLEKVIGQKQRLDYDRYGTLALADPQTPRPENLMQTPSVKDIINPIDVRGVIGLQYKPGKRWSAAIQYQYGLTDISNNHAFLNDHTNRNSLLKASIGFLIR